ncbi:MAG: methylated-DNA--[protein]-cysteine S-methyltransferase [Fimbriimonadaceae bacterium]|nr:methylated-DNA--[protein]-cysteine S-methyltransferase [Fimbriimonadaceae bacterium]
MLSESQGLHEAESPLTQAGREWLDAYLQGDSPVMDLPLDPTGPPFWRRVWQELVRIPPGRTTTYGELAMQIADRRHARAVGQACARNPLPIFIPCHRVCGADGLLHGYAWGLNRKRALLALESGQPWLDFDLSEEGEVRPSPLKV